MKTILLSVTADGSFYEKWQDILTNHSIGRNLWREIGWLIVKLLVKLCDACESLLLSANTAIKFITSKNVAQFVKDWRWVIVAVMVVSIIVFGYNLMTNSSQDRSKLLQNIIIALVVLMGTATIVTTLTAKTREYSKELLDVSSVSSSEKVLKGAIYDLYYLDSEDFSKESKSVKNSLPASVIEGIDPTETISSADAVSNPEVFEKKMKIDKNGKPVLHDIDDGGLVSFNDDTYYRYKIDFSVIYLTLIATVIVMIFTAFKVVKIVFDIIVHQILATLMAAGDWASGQKLKEVIKSLLALFFSVFMCSVMIKLYFLFSAWASTNITNSLVQSLLLIFAAFAVIDGPNIVEKLFGVDAGLANTFRSVSTLFFAGAGLARMAHGAMGLANAAARGATHTGGFIGGLIGGMKSGGSDGHTNIPSPGGENGGSVAGGKSPSSVGGDNNGVAREGTRNNSSQSSSSEGSSGKGSSKGNGAAQTGNNSPSVSSAGTQGDDNLNLNGQDAAGSVQNTASDSSTSQPSSIANAASKRSSNVPSYTERKSRNQRSVVGAGMRGAADGRSVGEKIGSRISNGRANRNLKED